MASKYSLPAALDIPADADWTKDVLDGILNYLWQNIAILNGFKPEWQSAIDSLNETGLARLNDAIQPIYDQLVHIAQLGVIFTATSASAVTIGTGQATFVLDASVAGQFAAAPYLAIYHTNDTANSMFGSLVSYDRLTGVLIVNVTQVSGAGTFSNWTVSIAPPATNDTLAQAEAYADQKAIAMALCF